MLVFSLILTSCFASSNTIDLKKKNYDLSCKAHFMFVMDRVSPASQPEMQKLSEKACKMTKDRIADKDWKEIENMTRLGCIDGVRMGTFGLNGKSDHDKIQKALTIDYCAKL